MRQKRKHSKKTQKEQESIESNNSKENKPRKITVYTQKGATALAEKKEKYAPSK